ncbi:MAG TPA: hypothetical protein VFR58_16230 [Flavisolibacter sp.]|nr:hypothetical protein [Flavisolibacter sp.]
MASDFNIMVKPQAIAAMPEVEEEGNAFTSQAIVFALRQQPRVRWLTRIRQTGAEAGC